MRVQPHCQAKQRTAHWSEYVTAWTPHSWSIVESLPCHSMLNHSGGKSACLGHAVLFTVTTTGTPFIACGHCVGCFHLQ